VRCCIAAQIATLPLQLAHFGMVSWAALILNLIAVPSPMRH
jgi:predicted membrane metal-binding protein